MNARADLSTISRVEAEAAAEAILGFVPKTVEMTRMVWRDRRYRFEFEVLRLRGLGLELSSETTMENRS